MPTPMYGVTSSLAENFSDRNGVTALMLQAKILDRVSSGPFRRSITIAWPIRSMTSARWDSSPTRVSSVTGCPVQVFVPAAKFATISFAVSLPGRSRYPRGVQSQTSGTTTVGEQTGSTPVTHHRLACVSYHPGKGPRYPVQTL